MKRLFLLILLPVSIAFSETDIANIPTKTNIIDLSDIEVLAEKGDVDAQLELGATYYNIGTDEKDYQEAMKWFNLAADQGSIFAMNTLGIIYYNGQIVKKDLTMAKKYLSKSCALKDKTGCMMYEELRNMQ